MEPDLAVPLPVFTSSSEDEDGEAAGASDDVDCAAAEASGAAGERMAETLRKIVAGDAAEVAPRLLDAAFWQELGAADGLHVCSLSAAGALSAASVASADAMRTSIRLRGYCGTTTGAAADDAAALERVKCGLRTLKRRGFAPAFIYVYDEAWQVLEERWRLLGHVLSPEAPQSVVLEPVFNAHVLTRPGDDGGAARAAVGGVTEISRHTSVGGAFPLPHRDHSSADVFGEHAADAHSGAMPRLLSLWVPLTEVTCDNGCMFVVPREADELLHQPHHPRHLTPFDQHSRRCHFDMSTAVALAPVAAGTALAWLGSSIHWGGVCSRYADAEPRASLTAAVRLRDAAHTQLQGQQEGSLPEVTLEALPLPLHERVRYACGSVLLYAWWYGLGRGVILPDEALEPQELEAR